MTSNLRKNGVFKPSEDSLPKLTEPDFSRLKENPATKAGLVIMVADR